MSYEGGLEIKSTVKKSWGRLIFETEATIKAGDPELSRSLAKDVEKYSSINNNDAYRIYMRMRK